MDDLRKLTEEIWRVYFKEGAEENFNSLYTYMDKDCVIIGTGRHELYKNLEEFEKSLSEEIEERDNIHFQFKNFWCEQVDISLDVCLVYGAIDIWWESDDKKVYVNMDSRFSILYKKTSDGWKIVHIHQSCPNQEQSDNEYYPKTLTEQVKRSNEKIKKLSFLAERDGLTQLINLRTFEECYQNWDNDHSWLFILDIDKFKKINDNHGHLVGNQVLKKVAATLEETLRSSDLVCRMGGDEFLILCEGLSTDELAEELEVRIQENLANAMNGQYDWSGVSIGRAKVKKHEPLKAVMERADSDMYKNKRR